MKQSADKFTFRVLCLCAAAYVLLFFSWCSLKYYCFAYDDFDLAIHDQIVWNILHGKVFNSILGIDFLGNHAHFISYLAAPIYALAPHPLFLLFLQTVFLAAGVFPLYALARRYLDSQLSLIVCIVYLLYPGLQFTNLYEFHPTCFAVFFLLCANYYFYAENFLWFNIFMFLTLISQENMPLIFIMWGNYAFILKRGWKWSLWPFALGLVYFLFCVDVVLPFFNKNVFNFVSIYGPLGGSLGQVAVNCVLHPLKVMGIAFQPHKVHYLFQLFAGVAFVPLFSPLSLLPTGLIFLQHLLSVRGSEVSLYFHYTAELIPFIFAAFVMGLKKIAGWESKYKILRYFIFFNAVLLDLQIGPFVYYRHDLEHLYLDYKAAQKERLVREIPPGAPVVTTFDFLSHLSHHQEIYSFHYVYWGFYTLSNNRFHLPEQTQYALVDSNDPLTFRGFYGPGNYRNLRPFLPGGPWAAVDVADTTVLFEKGGKAQYPLFNFIDSGKPPHLAGTVIDGRIRLNGYAVKQRARVLDLVFYWKSLKPEPKDVNLIIDFLDRNGKVIDVQDRPLCYRIWPTQAWVPGQSIEEHQYITVPPGMRGRLKFLGISFYDFRTGRILSTGTQIRLD